MKTFVIEDPVLSRIRDIIVNTVSPNKIILFGSRARGEATVNSDYDILIIKENIGNERLITRKVNYELLKAQIDSEIDLIATSSQKWEKNSDDISYIYHDIRKEGVILYG